jgi:hypothetical protein
MCQSAHHLSPQCRREVAKLSKKWNGLLANCLLSTPLFLERNGQAVWQDKWNGLPARLITIYSPFLEEKWPRQVEWTTSQAAHYLSHLCRREVAKLSEKWSWLLAKFLNIYLPF